MICKSCGARLYKNAKFCAHCGSKVEEIEESTAISAEEKPETEEILPTNITEELPKTEVVEDRKLSGKAITGFVLSLSGLIIAGIPCGIIGIIFSSIALGDIKRKNFKGKGFAVAGLVVSIVVLALSVIDLIDMFTTFISLYSYY